MSAVVIYLLIYGAMNLGAFAVVIAAARRTRAPRSRRSAACSRRRRFSPSLMTVFMASLAGIPPLAGWFAKFVMFRSIIEAGTGWAVLLAVIAAVNSVIAFVYYFRVIRRCGSEEATESRPPIVSPAAARGRDRAHCRARGRHRYLPAAVRTGRGARVLNVGMDIAQLIRREGPITFDASWKPPSTVRAASS